MKHLILIPALLVGCGGDGDSLDINDEVMATLPAGASNVRSIGNGWISFDLPPLKFIVAPDGSVAYAGPAQQTPDPPIVVPGDTPPRRVAY